MTIDSWISTDNPYEAQKTGTQVKLNSGANDYTLTAMYEKYGECSNCTNVVIPCKQYATLLTVTDTLCNPWASEISVAGTTGQQFSPMLWDEDSQTITQRELKTYSPEQGRTLNFTTTDNKTNSGTGDFTGF